MPEQMIKVRLNRPLDGKEIGEIAQYEKRDADRLAEYGAVEVLGPVKARQQPKKRKGAKPATPTPPALDPATVMCVAFGKVAFARSMPADWLRSPRWKRTGPAGKLASTTSLSPEKTDPSQYGM